MRFIKISKSNFRLDCFALSFCVCPAVAFSVACRLSLLRSTQFVRSQRKHLLNHCGILQTWHRDVDVLFMIIVVEIACGQSRCISNIDGILLVSPLLCIVIGLGSGTTFAVKAKPSQNNMNRKKTSIIPAPYFKTARGIYNPLQRNLHACLANKFNSFE